jgi:nitrite reductase/ring-hydroxylating ferredoxin subunit
VAVQKFATLCGLDGSELRLQDTRIMAETQVCAALDVPENGVISREVGDELVAIYNINGTYYATEARCTHGMADLADGTLEDDVIECNFHFGAFHVPSGKAVQPPCFIALKTFKTEVRDGQVYVDLDTPAPTAEA